MLHFVLISAMFAALADNKTISQPSRLSRTPRETAVL